MMKRSNIISINASLGTAMLLAACFVVGCSSSSSNDETDSSTTDAQAEANGTGGSAGSDAGDAAKDAVGDDGDHDANLLDGGDADADLPEGGDADADLPEGGDADADQPEGGEDVAPDVEKMSYGKIQTISFFSKFVFDASEFKGNELLEDIPYVRDHMDGVQTKPAAFVGVYGGDKLLPIPPKAKSTIAIAVSTPRGLQVIQQSTVIEKVKVEADPGVELAFKSIPKKGEVTIDTSDSSAVLWLTIAEKGDSRKRCVTAVGYGKLTVVEAGSSLNQLSLKGTDIELYAITDTPEGDISSKIKSLTGREPCKG